MIRAAVAALLLTAPAHALTMTEMGASLDACFSKTASIDETLTDLATQGWVLMPADAVPEAVIDNLVWSLAVYDLSGDVTAEQLTPVLENRRDTITTLLENPDAAGQQHRVLTRMIGRDRETLLLSRVAVGNQMQRVCRFTLQPRSVFGHAATAFAAPNTMNLGDDTDRRDTTIVLLNLAKLNALTNTPVPLSATLETNYSFDPADTQ